MHRGHVRKVTVRPHTRITGVPFSYGEGQRGVKAQTLKLCHFLIIIDKGGGGGANFQRYVLKYKSNAKQTGINVRPFKRNEILERS
jgi:hypothetical protein